MKQDRKYSEAALSFFETTQMLKKLDESLVHYHTTPHHILNKDKMDFYLHTYLLILLLCFIYKHSSVKIKQELQKNV